jgi:putative flavoprotein involved in K+ transport
MRSVDVAVIGGGPAGLSTAAALKHVGRQAHVFDRETAIGASWLHRYDRLHLHTIRAFSGLAYLPIPRSYPRYLSRDEYAEYLRHYRDHFNIDIALGCRVDRVTALPAMSNGVPRFLLQTNDGEVTARNVVVATGEFGTPIVPRVAEVESFRGSITHAVHYRTGRDYAGKRVLVVGLGNTGAEIATDLVEQGASYVAVSVRATPPVVPRDFLLTPVQLFGIALSRVPPHIADRIGSAIARVAIGDLRRYGLSSPQWFPFSAKRIPVIDVGFVQNLKAKRIAVRPPVDRFTQDGVVFIGGMEDAFDVVILATGYDTGLRTLLDLPGVVNSEGFPSVPSGARCAFPGLYFMGFFKSHRGHLFEISLASRRLARTIVNSG